MIVTSLSPQLCPSFYKLILKLVTELEFIRTLSHPLIFVVKLATGTQHRSHFAIPTEDHDSLDFFSDSLLPLYDTFVPSFGSPGGTYTYVPPPTSSLLPITVRIPPQEKNELFAHYQWRAGIIMADRIATGEVDVRGKVVLELGAGTGLPGLLCAQMGATKVIISDYDDPNLVRNLKDNIKTSLPIELQGTIEAVGYCWGSDPAVLTSATPTGSFDLILLADCLWTSASHDLLLASLTSLLNPPRPYFRITATATASSTASSTSLAPPNVSLSTPSIHIIAGFHTGREAIRSFIRKAGKLGLVTQGEWIEIDLTGTERKWGWDEDAEVEEPIEQRNKWIVEGRLVWAM